MRSIGDLGWVARGAQLVEIGLQGDLVVGDRSLDPMELAVEDAETWLPKLRHAGAIFVGKYSSESLGDYCAGPNHVLPTARTARFSSALGVYDFQKRTSIIQVSREGAQTLGTIAAELAMGEGLPAHAQSARYRYHG